MESMKATISNIQTTCSNQAGTINQLRLSNKSLTEKTDALQTDKDKLTRTIEELTQKMANLGEYSEDPDHQAKAEQTRKMEELYQKNEILSAKTSAMEQEIANLKTAMASPGDVRGTVNSGQNNTSQDGTVRAGQGAPEVPNRGNNANDETEGARPTYRRRRPEESGPNRNSHPGRFTGNMTNSAHYRQNGRSRYTSTSSHQSRQQSGNGEGTGRGNRQNQQQPANGEVTSRGVTGERTRSNIGQEKCLLIHDGTFSEFDRARFTKRYEVETAKCISIRKATADTEILDKIEAYKPGLIVMHLGYADIHEGREIEEVTGECKALIRSLCKKGKTCFSLPLVPQNNEHAEFRDKLQQFSDNMSDYITDHRREKVGGEFQVYTSHPGPLNTHVKIQNELPEAKITTAYGKVLLWIKFRDSLDRMTGRLLPRRRQNDNSTANNNES